MTGKLELNKENVDKLFMGCLLQDSDIKDGEAMCDYTLGEGINGDTYAFRTIELLMKKSKIESLILNLPDLNNPRSIMDLYVDRAGKIWGRTADAEKLAILGLASGLLEYVYPREVWNQLPFGVPIVKMVQKDNSKKPKGVEVPLGEEPKRD